MRRYVVVSLTALLLSGCASWPTEVTGVKFLGEVQDPRQKLLALAHAMRGQTVPDAIKAASAQSVDLGQSHEWTALVDTDGVQQRYTWLFAGVRGVRWNTGVTVQSDLVIEGYQLVLHVAPDGRVAAVEVEDKALPKAVREWVTQNVVSVGVATVGTLLMLMLR